MTGKYGLIGKKLGHSYSPQIHSLLGDYTYRLYEMEEADVEQFLKKRDFNGINVTIPYKKTVMPFLDRIDEKAAKIGCVNTIVKEADGTLTGYNTDYYGFDYMLTKGGIEIKDKKVLILGSGGASLTAKAVAEDKKAKEIIIVSRSGENNYENISRHFDADVIINTTPVGMYPNNLVAPLSPDGFYKLSGVADVIYNPKATKLILEAQKRNINCISGLYMLAAQGKKAAEYFFGKAFDDKIIDYIVKKLSFDLTNIALVGMPGCGKTTIGKILAEELGKEFADTDDIIVSETGKSIPDIFKEQGEKGFREIEKEVIKKTGKEKGLVIATGGGVVVTEENFDALRQNSTVIFLNRDISVLPKDGRPLSLSGDISEMYKKRLPLYRKISDFEIDCSGGIPDAVNKIKEILQ